MEPSGGTGMEYNKRLPVHFVGAFATTVGICTLVRTDRWSGIHGKSCSFEI